MGSVHDPEDGAVVAKTLFGAAAVYGVFLVFCGSQVWLGSGRRGGGEVRL